MARTSFGRIASRSSGLGGLGPLANAQDLHCHVSEQEGLSSVVLTSAENIARVSAGASTGARHDLAGGERGDQSQGQDYAGRGEGIAEAL